MEDVGAVQWAQIMTILQAQMVPGGQLAGLKDLRKSLHLWTGALPAAGVQLIELTEEPRATRRNLVTTLFHILVSADSTATVTGSTEVPANLDAALATLQPLVNDGNGNGITAILRANFGLVNASGQPLALRTQVKSVRYYNDIGAGETPQIFAYALIGFEAQVEVSII